MRMHLTGAVAGLALAALAAGCTTEEGVTPMPPEETTRAAPAAAPGEAARSAAPTAARPTRDELAQRLTPLQFHVTQESGTEPPFKNEFWNEKRAGVYLDVVSGEPLFSSLDKFDSGTGWPSFTRPIAPEAVVERKDGSHGMVRVEARSRGADSHLGHVFEDGPLPTGLRYCINSAALRFVPADELEAQGLGHLVAPFAAAGLARPATTAGAAAPVKRERAVLAGGCFWGMEEIIRAIPGVLETNVGYTGGDVPDATYEVVKKGRSGHAEAIEVVFDPSRLSYEQLLGWFFRMHDPTTKDRQGNDIGTQYRSAIFYTSEAQRQVAEQVKARVDASGKWPRPVVTQVVAAGPFYAAEDYHQDYLQKHPGGYTCHWLRD